MSNRREQFGSSTPSPVVRYYEWKSDEKKFGFYDKESGENKLVMPLKVAFLTTRACVRGWHDETESGIYSNEVRNTAQETLNVYSSKPNKAGNNLLATGIYKEIKGNLAGGHYEKVVYAYEFGVGVVKINLKGSGLMAYSTFEKEVGKKTFDFMIEVKSATSAKKGKVNYSTPDFTLGEALTKEQDGEVNVAFTAVDEYFKSREKSDEVETQEVNYQSTGVSAEELAPPKRTQEADALPF